MALQTVLLLDLLHTHQLPRLQAEVPDGLPHFMVGTNTPPFVDLLVRLLVPATGFRLVLLSCLLGQAFLGRELGMCQGEHDPLAGVTALLQFAGLLQRLDGGFPVPGPVLYPAQILPSSARL